MLSKGLLLFLVPVIFLSGCPYVEMNDGHFHAGMCDFEITPTHLLSIITSNDNSKLLDVREDYEYAENHIEDSLLLSVNNISQEGLDALGLEKTDEINEELASVAEEVQEVSVVALAVLNQSDEQGVIAGDKDKDEDKNEVKKIENAEKIQGIITPQATSTSSSSEQTSQISQAVSAPVPEPVNVLVSEEIEKESEEFGVGIGE